ncbi:uncharacterized protein SPPG_01299 [Spizellomyces punctatus DAOM BR117]|uniref:Uncharacterized protein n=1 Tax=Spizellomyces punctatus (strain DAOM BR117) TaxID=645134 RepID=A0A0L0HRT7_SPIPD|nr:uncharacterized protein SPPG_01299 [Spizellomyces punctatus DAOM BR117]KND03843.1 hypothetical protein SPPG_01299 [Spizellomyces punctatus DAOM BR117]|eukprot:XP_016611882.1 hypothetical protein SPPG_01299 [Spizellomyces punctatus DAOM BR117]
MLRTRTSTAVFRRPILSRSFRTTPKCRDEAVSDESSQSAETKLTLTPQELARQRADAWLKEESGGLKFKNASTATFVGKGDRPFPMNPLFRPQAPLNDATRNEIFKFYLEDPKHWTPRALAEHFGLSIVRVQAILRLKALGEQWKKEDKPLQTELTRGMENMLNSVELKPGQRRLRPREQLRSTPAKRLQPFFRMMNEEELFTPEDAAKLMQMDPYANLQRKLDEAADHVFQMEAPKSKEVSKPLREDAAQKSRFQFMIVDNGNVEKAKVLIRDRDGKLRNATVEERFRRKNQKPKFIM